MFTRKQRLLRSTFCRRCGALDFRSYGPQLFNHSVILPLGLWLDRITSCGVIRIGSKTRRQPLGKRGTVLLTLCERVSRSLLSFPIIEGRERDTHFGSFRIADGCRGLCQTPGASRTEAPDASPTPIAGRPQRLGHPTARTPLLRQ